MEIDISKKNKKISIARFPKFMNLFLSNITSAMDLGELVITDDGTIKLNINKSLDKTGIIPTEFNVKKVDKSQVDMYIISSTPVASSADGVIENEFIVTPVINKKYMEFKKTISNKRINTTEVIDYSEENIKVESLGSLREMDFLARKRKQMLINKKRERLDKDEVLNIIFNAFEKYESWTVKDLADFTGQPIAFIQEIVNEICDADKKEHKNIYTLKDEYK